MKLPGGVVDEAQDQHGAQDEHQLVCGLHGRLHGTIQVITCNTNTGRLRKATRQLRRDGRRPTQTSRGLIL